MIVADLYSPPSVALTVDRGAAPVYSFGIRLGGAPLDVTGSKFGIVITDLPWRQAITSDEADADPMITVTDAANGKLRLHLPAAVTDLFRATYAPRFMIWIAENGGKRPICSGVFQVRDHV